MLLFLPNGNHLHDVGLLKNTNDINCNIRTRKIEFITVHVCDKPKEILYCLP